MFKKFSLIILILICAIAVIAACDDTELTGDPDNTITTPLDVYNYIYTSIDKALAIESGKIEYAVSFNGGEADDAVTLFKKSGGVILADIDSAPMVYTDGKAYYGDEYADYAAMDIRQFLAIAFNNTYEVNFEYFLFSDSIEFVDEAGGHKLTCQAYIYPHLYTLELHTDVENALKSMNVLSVVPAFTREIEITVSSGVVTGVPIAETLTGAGADDTVFYSQVAEISTYVYAYSQLSEMESAYYTTDNIAALGNAVYNTKIKEGRGLRTDANGYSYYNNGTLYITDISLTPAYNQHIYYEMTLNGFKYRAMSDALTTFRFAEGTDLDKTVDGDTVTYDFGEFSYVISGGKLARVITYNSFSEEFEIFVYSDASGDMVAPSINQGEYYSDGEAYTISCAYYAYTTSESLFDNSRLYYSEDPENYEYGDALYVGNFSVLDSAPVSFAYDWYYIIVRPTQGETVGEVLETYYTGEGGTYKAYRQNTEIVWAKVAD